MRQTGQAEPRRQDAASAGALTGCTIVEIGLDETGQYAGMLLARLGARVIKFESLEGDAERRLGPMLDDRAATRRSVPYEFLNGGKSSVALDLDDAFAFDLLAHVPQQRCAVLVGPQHAGRIAKELAVPVIACGPFGASGLNVALPSSPLTRFQAGGSGYLMASERPVVPGTRVGDSIGGVGLALCVASLLLMDLRNARDESGGLRADYSQHAHAANLEKIYVARAARQGAEPDREEHRYPFGGAVPCRDGHVSMLIFEEHQWGGLARTIGKPEWATDPRFAGGAGRRAMKVEISAALGAWCARRTTAEVLAAARPAGVAIGAVRGLEEVLSDEWLVARGFVGSAETPFGEVRIIGLPFGADPLWRQPAVLRAPRLGEHTALVLRELGHDADSLALLEQLDLVCCDHALA